MSKNLKKTVKENFNSFCVDAFYMGRKSFINKKGFFYAKFFEFKEFSIVLIFSSSIQPQHTVSNALCLKIMNTLGSIM